LTFSKFLRYTLFAGEGRERCTVLTNVSERRARIEAETQVCSTISCPRRAEWNPRVNAVRLHLAQRT